MTASVSHLRAIGYALAGFAVWVLSDGCLKLASEAGVPPYETVGFLGLFGVLFTLARTNPRRVKALWPKSLRKQGVRSLLAFSCGVTNAIALKHLSLAVFYIIVFTAPMMIALLAALFLKEHLTWRKSLAILVGFAGIIVALDPHDLGRSDWIGYSAAFASAVSFSCSVTWLRVITQSESNDSLVFFTALVEGVLGFAFTLGHMVWVTPKTLLILCACGSLATIGNFAIYKALRHTTAATVSQFHYTQIITGCLLGYLVWNDVPTWNMLGGIGIIIASGLYVAAHARKAENIATVMPSH